MAEGRIRSPLEAAHRRRWPEQWVAFLPRRGKRWLEADAHDSLSWLVDIHELTAMVVRHDGHLRAVHGDITEIKEQLRWQQQVAAYRTGL